MADQDHTGQEDFSDKLSGVFTANIGRIVAFVLAPILVVAVPPVVDGLNTVLGTDFTNQEISNIAIATVVGLAIVVYKWLHNRGEWETKLAELNMLYEAGRENVEMHDFGPPPVPTPEPDPAPVTPPSPADPGESPETPVVPPGMTTRRSGNR